MTQAPPPYYPPTPPAKSGLSRNAKILIIGGIIFAVLIVSVVAYAFFAGVQQYTTSTTQPGVTSATITVYCDNCVYDTSLWSHQFSGAYGQAGSTVSVDGDSGATYTITRTDKSSIWIISWSFQTHSNYPGHSMEVKVVLNTATQVYDQSTTADFGVVTGSWSTTD